MIELINGRGQLGNTLRKIIEKEKIILEPDVAIYHTWNIDDKSEAVQKECYESFKKFVNENSNTKIVFTSTYSQTENYYNYYKQLSEAYLLSNHEKGYVLRLPTLIGKGIFERFRNDSHSKAYGDMEIMSIEDAAEKILKVAKTDNLLRNFRVNGTIISAKLVKDLILFGKYKK